MTSEPPGEEQERHASWAELFFDLVAVAGVAALAHLLHDEITAASLALYGLLFLAFWLSWTTFMLYANIAGSNLHLVRLLSAMFGLGVMAAAVPSVAATVLDGADQTAMMNAFALAYFLTRVIGATSWGRDTVVVDFPLVQRATGAIPWLVSLWVDEPWKLALWVVGIAIDVLLLAFFSPADAIGAQNQRVDAIKARIESGERRHPERARRDKRRLVDFSAKPAAVDQSHFGERLGLFVIIVLGEGVVQIVAAASGVEANRGLLHAGLASFVLLCGMFALSVLYGYAGVPHLRAGRIPIRGALALHALVTATIATVAVALAIVIEHAGEPLLESQRWLLCGSMAVYFSLGVVAAVSSGRVNWKLHVPALLTGVCVPILLGVIATDANGTALVWYLVLVVFGHLAAERHVAARG